MVHGKDTHANLATQKWDAIVIGSGLGGMTTGCLLAKAGKKVLLLERHSVPGGFTHTFKRKGFEWDVGVHYVGQVSNRRSIIRMVFDYVTDGRLRWEQMDSVYDRAVIAGDRYEYVAGTEAQTQNLIRMFPDEAAAIRTYIKLVRSTARSAAWFFGEKTMPFWKSQIFGRLLRRRFEKWNRLTTAEVLNSLTQNQKLIAVLCAQCGDYGLTPAKSSFGIHAVVVEHYLEGASYPVGGASQIHKSILSVFHENGGTLALQADVQKILTNEGRATGVELQGGLKLQADVIVSNAGFKNTYSRLLDRGDRKCFDDQSAVEAVGPSTAHICLYVGLDASDAELGLPKNNIWIYESYDFDQALQEKSEAVSQMTAGEMPLVYISFPTAKDPERDRQNGGRATIQVIAAYDFKQVQEWQDRGWRKRGQEYENIKAALQRRLTAAMIKALPQVEGRIAYSELSTPLSTRHFMNYQTGEIYGLEHTPARFQMRSLRPQTRIKGLFLTGQDIVTVGVGGALYSGVLTATAVLKKSVILRILLGWPLQRRAKPPLVSRPVVE